MALTRASSLDLFLACNGYLHLPSAPTFYAKASDAADWGTMVHTWKETGKVVHAKKSTAASFRRRLKKLKIERSDYYGDGLHEISVAYNWKLGYVVPFYGQGDAAKKWKEQFGLDWVTGTVDYCETVQVGTEELAAGLLVDDLKTGKWWTKRPRESAQIIFYCLCMSKLYRANVNARVTHWPRYPAKGLPTQDTQLITIEELDRFEAKLQAACEAAIMPKFNPSEDACRFCPGRNACLYTWSEESNETY